MPICEALRAPLSCSIAGYAKTVYFGVVILQYDNSGPRSAGALGGSQNSLGVKIFYYTPTSVCCPTRVPSGEVVTKDVAEQRQAAAVRSGRGVTKSRISGIKIPRLHHATICRYISEWLED